MQRIGKGRGIAAAPRHLLHLIIFDLGLRRLGPRQNQLLIEFGDLLLRSRSILAPRPDCFRTEQLDRPLGILNLGLQFAKPLIEPVGRPLGRVIFRLELVDEIFISERIGD